MIEDLDFSQVPRSWALCYVAECPRKEECLRYQACLKAPPLKYLHKCVMPNILQKNECHMFRPIRKLKVALGFRNIFIDVKARDITKMRTELTAFLGSPATYFRYRNGTRPLTPMQQQWIEDMFRRYGYNGDVVYDKVKDVYFFD